MLYESYYEVYISKTNPKHAKRHIEIRSKKRRNSLIQECILIMYM